jgi:predicted nucleic acid-binding protein
LFRIVKSVTLLYLDSSALVKRYVRELASEEVVREISSARSAATAAVTLAELTSAFARLAKGGALSLREAEQRRAELVEDWKGIICLPIDDPTIELAATVAWEHRVRGFDAIHLASALNWMEEMDAPVRFATFDRQLWRAARETGLDPWPERFGDS